jgi:hypothetical protein
MRKITLQFICILLSIIGLNAQATLPFSYDGGNPFTGVPGLIASNLGSPDYSTSPKIKLSNTASYVILNFNGIPGTLTYNLKWNPTTTLTRFPGTFALQESPDGLIYTDVQVYDNINGPALAASAIVPVTINTLKTTTRYVKWLYSNKTNGNIALGSINLSPKVINSQSPVQIEQVNYSPKGSTNEYSFSNKWIFSYMIGNYNASNDLLGTIATVRGMAVKNGKMLFPDKINKQIIIVNGETGAKENGIALASNTFTYTGRNKANTADSIWTAGVSINNDLKVDNAGNVLISNLITANTDRFQIWKIDMTTGNGILVIDHANLASLFPSAATMRFDAFGVTGDVANNAVIFAVNASAMEVYKWKIVNGISQTPSVITLDNTTAGTDFQGLANLGTAPQVFPLNENVFYVDGNVTNPILVNGTGMAIDGFRNTAFPNFLNVDRGHNGVFEFSLYGENFLVAAATNTLASPPSTFKLYRFTNPNKSFSSLELLWSFPQAGMGDTSNPYRSAIPTVEVSGQTAKIYVYTGENGYGMYEFKMNGVWTDYKNSKIGSIEYRIENQKILFSQIVKKIEVFNVAGQIISCKSNTNEVNINLTKGIYIVTISSESGMKQTEKKIIR